MAAKTAKATIVRRGLPAAARKAGRQAVIASIADYIGTAGDTYANSEVARAGIAAELRRLGVEEHLSRTLARADAERPLPSVSGLGDTSRAAHAAGPYYRAAYLVRAAERVQSAVADPDRSGVEQLAREQDRYLTAHQAAQTARERGALRLDAARDTWGGTLGWYAYDDDRTTPECREADGQNFDPTDPPAIGLPGVGPHVGCRCYAGPAHEGASMMAGGGTVHPPAEIAASVELVSGDTSPFSSSRTSNWVAKAGGLPGRVRAIARAIQRKHPEWDLSRCIATAINAVKYSAATGDSKLPGRQNERASTVASHGAAAAEWEAKKARAHAHTAPGAVALLLAVQDGSVPVRSAGDGPRVTKNTAAKGVFLVAHAKRKRSRRRAIGLAVKSHGLFDEAKHPRGPKGTHQGGKFVSIKTLMDKAKDAPAVHHERNPAKLQAKSFQKALQTGKAHYLVKESHGVWDKKPEGLGPYLKFHPNGMVTHHGVDDSTLHTFGTPELHKVMDKHLKEKKAKAPKGSAPDPWVDPDGAAKAAKEWPEQLKAPKEPKAKKLPTMAIAKKAAASDTPPAQSPHQTYLSEQAAVALHKAVHSGKDHYVPFTFGVGTPGKATPDKPAGDHYRLTPTGQEFYSADGVETPVNQATVTKKLGPHFKAAPKSKGYESASSGLPGASAPPVSAAEKAAKDAAKAEKVAKLPPTHKLTEAEVMAHYKASVDATHGEKMALSDYTGSGYADLNKKLRAGKEDELTAMEKGRMYELDNLSAKYKLPATAHVNRGIGAQYFQKTALKPGTIYKDPGFVSTSHKSGFSSKPIQFKITVPKGTKAISVNSHGVGVHSEHELILPRGTKFAITSDTGPTGDSWNAPNRVIHMTAIPE
jgi:hypothetical protein